MFGIGFSEFIIIAIVAIVIVGPERLPGMARTIGRFAWEMRRAWDDVRQTVRDEVMQASEPFEEIRKAGEQIRKTTRETTENFRKETEKFKQTAEQTLRDTERDIKEAAKGQDVASSAIASAKATPDSVDVTTSQPSPQTLGKPAAALAGGADAPGEPPEPEATHSTDGTGSDGQPEEKPDAQAGEAGSTEAVARGRAMPRKRARPAVEYFDLDGNQVPQDAS